MNLLSTRLLLFAALLVAASLRAQKISPKVAELAQQQPKVACFILLTEQADLAAADLLPTKIEKGRYVWNQLQNASSQQAELVALLRTQNSFHIPQTIVNAIYAELSPAQIQSIALRPDVARILPNTPIKAHFPVANANNHPATLKSALADDTLTWGLTQIQAHKLWEKGIRGQNTVIGGQDTGYDWLHPAINGNYRGQRGPTAEHNYNWHDAIHAQHPLNPDSNNPCGFNTNQPCDDGSHGTHTMGTMLGQTTPDGVHIGVAPAAQWVGCRNMERGWGTPQTYIECFEWFLAPTDLQNQNPNPEAAPHVINNSWGCPEVEGCHPDNFEMMRLAVKNLRAAGVVVVVSAGNDGPDCHSISNPASIFAESFTVGATDRNDTVIYFSSRGTVLADESHRIKPNIVAPGVGVLSSFPQQNYGTASGTSMAGPHVAGLVALLISADPSLAGQVGRIEELIQKTADPVLSTLVCGDIPSTNLPNPISGYGRVNAWAALSIIRPDLVSSNPLDKEEVRLYPNPAAGQLWVITPFDAAENTSVRIFNALGQLVWEQQHSFYRILELDVQNLPKGVYYLSITPPNEKRPHTRAFYKL